MARHPGAGVGFRQSTEDRRPEQLIFDRLADEYGWEPRVIMRTLWSDALAIVGVMNARHDAMRKAESGGETSLGRARRAAKSGRGTAQLRAVG